MVPFHSMAQLRSIPSSHGCVPANKSMSTQKNCPNTTND
uniref:Uncharacterized protein n=1 Tax=Arundo donax TaxID=35708 RepID=A0A0A9DPY8_ARUDO